MCVNISMEFFVIGGSEVYFLLRRLEAHRSDPTRRGGRSLLRPFWTCIVFPPLVQCSAGRYLSSEENLKLLCVIYRWLVYTRPDWWFQYFDFSGVCPLLRMITSENGLI